MKLIIRLIIAMHCIVSLSSVRAQSPALLTTFLNPTPEANDEFAWSIAAIGTDRVLIGAPFEGPTNAGAVYLFRTNGVLLKHRLTY